MRLNLNIFFLFALLLLAVSDPGRSLLSEGQFHESAENSGIAYDDEGHDIQEDDYSGTESSYRKIFLIPGAAAFCDKAFKTTILDLEIWNPPKNNP